MLTTRQIDSARPKDKPYKLTDTGGLYLAISPAGGKSWRYNHTQSGKQKTETYGRYPEMTLAEARKAHQTFKEGPKVVEKPTFKEMAERWLKVHLPTLENAKHKIQVANTLEEHVYPQIGDMRIDTIKRTDFVKVVKAVSAKGIIETAHRVAGRICMVMNLAVDEGEIDFHAAAGLVRVIDKKPKVQHMASINPKDAPQLLKDIDTYPEPVTHLGLYLMAHTFVRTNELRWFSWDEIIWEDNVWVIPEDKMKKRKLHVVPLSPQVIKRLKNAQASASSSLVLESPLKRNHPISENTLLFALYRLGYKGKMTGHGFRALASTVLNEQSGFAENAIERQLAHKEDDAVKAAYNRAEYLPQRRELMKWWSNWLDQQRKLADQKPASEPLHQSSQVEEPSYP